MQLIAGGAAKGPTRRRLVGLPQILPISALFISVSLLEQSQASSVADSRLSEEPEGGVVTTYLLKPIAQTDKSEQEDASSEEEYVRRLTSPLTESATTLLEQPHESSELSPESDSRAGLWWSPKPFSGVTSFRGGGDEAIFPVHESAGRPIGLDDDSAPGHTPTAHAAALGAGAKLDEGFAKVKGGGFPACGLAPLNQLTPRDGRSSYIYNGERQSYGEFPQFVQLEARLTETQFRQCAGALVSDRHILTAAHCTKDGALQLPPSVFDVTFGEDSLLRVDAHEKHATVSKVCVSAQFSEGKYDWALLTLSRPVKFSDYIQPACLPRREQLIHTHGPRSRCFLVGAGAIGTRPDVYDRKRAEGIPATFVMKLRAENVPCTRFGFGQIDTDRVCYARANKLAGGSCLGDSGGPVLCLDEQRRWTLMATVSYGVKFCEESRAGVYARTRTLLSEIEQHCEVALL